LCLTIAILSSLLACSSATPKALSVDIASSGKEVTLAAGGMLTVTLESNITTGYSWSENASIADKTVIQQTDHKYQPPATPIPGAGGKEVWTFKALKAGKLTISMEYKRPFEPTVAPAKTFSLILAVQ
jgi:inhibitor of cysteine peptidase